MSNLSECQGLLTCLNGNTRTWGQSIDAILMNFAELSDTDRSKLRASTEVKTRFDLMHQYFEHFGRTYSTASSTEFSKMIENALFLVALDNFEYDFRETILRLERFIDRAESRPKLFESEWRKSRNHLPKRAKLVVENRLNLG